MTAAQHTARLALTLSFALAASAPLHAQQVGALVDGVYYTVNPHLAAGTRLQILPDDGRGVPQCCAVVTGPARHAPTQVLDSLHDRTVTAYAVTLPHSVPADTNGFGIAGNATFGRRGAHPEATLDDGLRLAFATCTSSEGEHYLGRKVGDGKLLVHLYQYIDADLEGNCRDADLADGTRHKP